MQAHPWLLLQAPKPWQFSTHNIKSNNSLHNSLQKNQAWVKRLKPFRHSVVAAKKLFGLENPLMLLPIFFSNWNLHDNLLLDKKNYKLKNHRKHNLNGTQFYGALRFCRDTNRDGIAFSSAIQEREKINGKEWVDDYLRVSGFLTATATAVAISGQFVQCLFLLILQQGQSCNLLLFFLLDGVAWRAS